MAGTRQAFIWASLGRYGVLIINITATIVMARLLTPAEFGVSVLGAAVFAVAEAIRALGGGAYLIQQKDLTRADTRATFTVCLTVTLILAIGISASAGTLTRYYNMPELARYLQVIMLGYLVGPFVYPISALMVRQFAFGRIAKITVITAVVNAVTGIVLATQGFSYMSLAWANTIANAVSMVLYFASWQEFGIFVPQLRRWRSVVAFGAFDSATGILAQIGESLPYFIFGRLLSAEAVGICQRTMLLCLFPERVILAGVGAVALPAFTRQAREGLSLKDDYVRANELITAAQWAALLLLVVLAEPVVSILLGPRWHEVTPLLRILGTAMLFSFPISLNYPTLVAVGAIRYVPPLVMSQVAVTAVVLWFAAASGLQAVAVGMLLAVPFNGLVSLLVIKHFVGFEWRPLLAAMGRSAVCAGLSAVGPFAITIAATHDGHMGLGATFVAVAVSAAGWFIGLWATGHQLQQEVVRAGRALRNRLGTMMMSLPAAPRSTPE